MHKVPITNLTVSFIESRFPKKLFKHLREIRGYVIEKNSPGIYTVKGDILPIQIINSRQLSEEENLWLKNLSDKLDPLAVLKIGDEAKRQDKVNSIRAYMDVIAKANFNAIEEAINMSSPAKSLDEVFIRTGLAAKWQAMAEERNSLNIARNMVKLGLPIETVVSATRLDLEKVKKLFQQT